MTVRSPPPFSLSPIAQVAMRSCFFRPIWSTKQRERFLDNRARVTAADLHDRLIGFKAAREALFAALEGEWMDGGSGFITLSSPLPPCPFFSRLATLGTIC